MKLKFLEIETIMLHLVFFISWDQEQKSENKCWKTLIFLHFWPILEQEILILQ